ncbi:MAG TPA: DUF2341 domain-containing protein [Candidatus Thermoplasmatota archaeon]|nr:DUF2341 domain-containing protein [Candidatus Thermoplasmatota archaeon]
MVISVTVKDTSGIETVQAKNYHEKGYDITNLQLASGTIYNGVWKGTWVVHDTLSKEYDTVITARSYSHLFSSITVPWSDPAWWNMNWNYRKLADIQNPSLDYQMKITIGFSSSATNVDVHLEGKCKTDFSDVRFTNKNNSAELSYWMENKTNGDKAQFWIKTNGEDALNIYYGNASASSKSNASAVFLFFDDFSGSSLDTNKWDQINSGTGTITINAGNITIASSGDWWSTTDSSRTIISKTSFNDNYIAEAFIGNHGQDGYNRFFGLRSSSATNAKAFILLTDGDRSHITNVYRDSVAGSANWYGENSGAANPGSNKIAKFVRIGDTVNSYYSGSLTNSRTVAGWGLIYVALTDTNSASNPTKFDWIRVHKYASPEPQWNSFGIQEVSLPTEPILSQPTDASVTVDTTPTFLWNVSQYADNHTLQVSDHLDFSILEINISLGPTTDTFTPILALEEGKWYWRIRANNSQGINISDTWSVIIDTTAPEKPLLVAPSDNHETNNNHVIFSWNETADNTTNTSYVSGIASYQLQISNDNFTSYLVNQNTSDNATFSITATIAGRLQWRVRAWDQAGNPGVFSETRNLTVFDFSLTATSSTLTILRGGTGSTTIQIQKSYGDDEAITLTNEWSGITPTGISVDISTESGNGSFTSNIDFETSGDASTGEFIFNVIATSLTGTRTISLTVRIAGMIFMMSSSPTAFSLTRSDADESRITITFQYGSKDTVSLSGAWIGSAPVGVTTSFNRVTDLPPFDSILSISTSNQASSGKYTYKITATGGGISDWIYISLEIKTNLTLTLQSDKTTYEKGQEIHLSGTVHDPNGNVVKSGMVTLNFSTGTWSEQITTNVTNSVFQTKYFVTFDKFEGNWVISATAIDSLGHQTIIATRINIDITVPETYKYYTITVLSPLPGQVYKRGDEVSFTVSIVENETKIRDATVSIQSPDGAKIFLSEISPGLYTKSYKLKMNSKLGNWSVYIAGSTGENEMFKAGFSYIPIKVEPTQLSLEIIEPTTRSFETGEKITLVVKLFYLEGSPVEEGIVSITKTDGTILNFKKSGNGLYTTGYTVTDEDLGYLNMEISAIDVYGNLGVTKGTTFAIIPMQVSSYFVRYWWATSILLIGLIVALGIVTRDVSRTVRLRNFKREVIELGRLKKDKATEYFITGSISRETYDNLLQEYESKLAKLEKQRHILEKKMKKKKM